MKGGVVAEHRSAGIADELHRMGWRWLKPLSQLYAAPYHISIAMLPRPPYNHSSNEDDPMTNPEPTNPRYAIWRASTGETLNHEFMAWIGHRWIEWCALNGRNRDQPKSRQDHADFDAWLSERYS